MSLPILKVVSTATPETLIRYYHQTESKWTAHLAESELLEVGTAWSNPQLPRVWDANRVMDVSLPQGLPPQNAFELVEAHFQQRGTRCWQWVMNSSAKSEQTQPMVDFLLSRGYTRRSHQIMHLDRMPTSAVNHSATPLRIIPARASFRHSEILHQESSQQYDEPQLTQAKMLHLDDPHYDALLALSDGQAAAFIGVLAVGEIGRIDEVYVASAFRRQRIGTTMMSRALEICARSLFKHVMLGVLPDHTESMSLYGQFGFKPIGEFVAYQAP
jgi:ribosomal protein S18 acetylase RimI-like enzyme